RFRLTEISAAASTVPGQASREEGQAELPVRSLGASQFGITVLQSVLPGVHVGTTLKYVRGTLRAGPDDPAAPTGDLLDRGDDLSGGDAGGRFDLDVGVLAVDGPFSIGAVV